MYCKSFDLDPLRRMNSPFFQATVFLPWEKRKRNQNFGFWDIIRPILGIKYLFGMYCKSFDLDPLNKNRRINSPFFQATVFLPWEKRKRNQKFGF